MPGLLGNSGGAGDDDFEHAGKVAPLPLMLVAAVVGLVGIGGGADRPLASIAGPETILLPTVGDVDIVLCKGAPAKAGLASLVLVVRVGEAGVELIRSGARSEPALLPSDSFVVRDLVATWEEFCVHFGPSALSWRKGFESPRLSSSLLSPSDMDIDWFHHCWCSSEGSGRLSSSEQSDDSSPPPASPMTALFACSSCFRISLRFR